MKSSATFSDCGKYRYSLKREWDKDKPFVLFICLNPSTADDKNDDPTLIRCISYAKQWGYGGVCVTNLFAYRATNPRDMLSSQDPIGIDNDKWLRKLSKSAGLVVAAWGNHGKHIGRSDEIRKAVSNLYYLKLNASGEPSHPLYLKSNLKPKLST
jgi:hypothetical protein